MVLHRKIVVGPGPIAVKLREKCLASGIWHHLARSSPLSRGRIFAKTMMLSAGEGWGEGDRFLSIHAGFSCRERRGIGGTAVKRAFAIHGTLGENIVFSTVLQQFHQHPGVPDSSVPRQKTNLFSAIFSPLPNPLPRSASSF